MKVTIEVDCTPQEARAFLGLPDITQLNEQMVAAVKDKVAANIQMLQPDELMRTWMSFGGQAQEQFMRMVQAAAGGKG